VIGISGLYRQDQVGRGFAAQRMIGETMLHGSITLANNNTIC